MSVKLKLTTTVKVHYTEKIKTGEIFDSSLEREPLEVYFDRQTYSQFR